MSSDSMKIIKVMLLIQSIILNQYFFLDLKTGKDLELIKNFCSEQKTIIGMIYNLW